MGSGVGKKLGSLLERLEAVEQTIPAVANAVQQVVNQMTSRLDNLDRVVMALVELTGKDAVSAMVQEMMTKEANEAADKAKANLDTALATGQVTPAQFVANDSLVVGQETDPTGAIIVPGRIQLAFSNFKPELQEAILTKKVGDVVDTVTGGKFTILEIYQVLPEGAVVTTAPVDTTEPTLLEAVSQ